MHMPRIRIVDYGVGNIHSALKALRLFSDDVELTEDAAQVRGADALVLPGQGAFESGMKGLRVRGLLDDVRAFACSGKPVLGICLGAQILMDTGFEFGEWQGLGIIPGEVVRFPPLDDGAKVPHMGWSAIEQDGPERWKGTALEGLRSGSDMYFIHSFILQPADPAHALAWSVHGGVRFPSVVGRGKVIGCQFHPEKSGREGLRIIENFVKMAEVVRP